MITAKGIGFLIAAILVYALARLTQVGWLYLVDALLWGLILMSVFLPWLGIAFLDARRSLSQAFPSPRDRWGPVAGEPVSVALSLRNRAFVPRFFLRIIYDCPFADPENRLRRFFVAKLDGSRALSLESTVVAERRGQHHLGPVEVESSAPFGLFRRRAQLAAPLSVLVYPQVFPIKRLGLVDGTSGMIAQPQKSRVGMDTVGSRPYFPGDPRRHIHWRNTARVGRPVVREFEDPQDQALCILFDASQAHGADSETTLEYGVRIAASVAFYALRSRVSVRVWGGHLRGEVTAPQGASSRSWPELYKGLALVTGDEERGLSESLSQVPHGGNALMVVSASDLQSIRTAGLVAPLLRRLVVVALEGFGEPDSDLEHDPLGPLERARIPLARCRPGQLPELAHTLERLGVAASPLAMSA